MPSLPSSSGPLLPPVLIAEDDLALAGLLTEFLREEGYDVVAARDGLTALHYAIRHTPAAILMDGHLPRLDGFAFARIYRELPGPHAPLALMTGDLDAYRRENLFPPVELLAKPFALEDLSALLTRLIGQSIGAAHHTPSSPSARLAV